MNSIYYNSFAQIIKKVKSAKTVKRMAVAAAGYRHILEAVIDARKTGLAQPVLIGNTQEILTILKELGESVPGDDVINASDGVEACELAVKLIREGKADFLMKGNIDTSVLLKSVVNKETGLAKGALMSHFTIFEIPSYHKLLTIVDGGMVPYPTLEQKKHIIENTVTTLLDLGYTCPKVGVLACVEKINPKMPETVEADELTQMNQRGEIKKLHCERSNFV